MTVYLDIMNIVEEILLHVCIYTLCIFELLGYSLTFLVQLVNIPQTAAINSSCSTLFVRDLFQSVHAVFPHVRYIQWSLYFKTTYGTKKTWSYIACGLKIKVI